MVKSLCPESLPVSLGTARHTLNHSEQVISISGLNVATTKTFADFNLVKPLVKAAAAEQYHTATPIQEAAIPKIMMGRDILGVAAWYCSAAAAFTSGLTRLKSANDLVVVTLGPEMLPVCSELLRVCRAGL